MNDLRRRGATVRELTPRAILVAILAALMGAAEPAVVLKIGYGPNMSVVSAFLGFIAISLIGLITGARGTRFENDLVPGFAVFPMIVGGAAQAIWRRASPRSEAVYDVPLASGFSTGEALVLLALAVVAAAS
jgi:hypothetical protein